MDTLPSGRDPADADRDPSIVDELASDARPPYAFPKSSGGPTAGYVSPGPMAEDPLVDELEELLAEMQRDSGGWGRINDPRTTKLAQIIVKLKDRNVEQPPY